MLAPGETFSYWKLIGKPSRRKGYLEGMVLFLGRIGSDVGGGLCRLLQPDFLDDLAYAADSGGAVSAFP
ncbi:MAG: VanW family protein [Dysosmobacter sp.]